MKVDVRLDYLQKVLAYDVPDGTPVGAHVLVPLPWFLDYVDGRLDYPNGIPGIVVGPTSYNGPCKKARVVEE